MGILETILLIISGFSIFKVANITKQAPPQFQDDLQEILKDKNKLSAYPDGYQKYFKAFFAYFLVFLSVYSVWPVWNYLTADAIFIAGVKGEF